MRDFHMPGRSVVMAGTAMAATSHPLATQVAVQMLKDGGNAVDAAIAAAVLLGICEPHMTGIGGDCFALVQPGPGADPVGLNGSGRAPAAADAAALRAQGHAKIDDLTADAVTIPGAIDAFLRLSADYGSKSMAEVLAPAIHYAGAGVPVAPRVAYDWAIFADRLSGPAREMFLLSGKPAQTGQIFRAPAQIDTLRRIAAEGRAGFYEGPVAEDMVNALHAAGGVHTLDDFAAQTSNYVDPVRGQYRGLDLVELPPNGQGAAAILLANMLSEFDIASMDPGGVARMHLEAEATKLAYGARDAFVADPATAAPHLDGLLSKAFAQDLAARIDPDRAGPFAPPMPGTPHRDTVYLTVVDKDRMAVSLIYSLFASFGTGIAAPQSGVLFHSRGAGFNLIEGHPNEMGPGKRPMHTIIPGMIFREDALLMPFGVMGGQYQAAGHARFLSNLADFGMEVQEAIDFPRLFPELGQLKVERGYPEAHRADLAAKGHDVIVPDQAIGGAQAIRIDPETGVLWGASDPRKDGCALGY